MSMHASGAFLTRSPAAYIPVGPDPTIHTLSPVVILPPSGLSSFVFCNVACLRPHHPRRRAEFETFFCGGAFISMAGARASPAVRCFMFCLFTIFCMVDNPLQ